MGRLSLEVLKHNIVCQKPEDSLQQIKYAAVRKFQAEGNHSLLDPNINSKSWQKIKAAMKQGSLQFHLSF